MFQLKKTSVTLFVILILLVLFLVVENIAFKFAKTPHWDIERKIRYGFTLKNKSSKPLQNIIFKTYSPLTISSNQKLIKLISDRKFTKKVDKYGNQTMIFNVDFIPPYGMVRINVTAGLLLSRITAGAGTDDKLFLHDQPLIETNNNSIQKLAKSFSENSGQVQKQIFEWLEGNINYSGYGLRDRGALYALENLQGDCTEFAYLNVAINRVLGYPSRAVNGYVINHDAKINATGFHTWSEVWFDDGWQVIDAQKNIFLTNQHNYIAMNIVIDKENIKKDFKRFWISDPDLLVTMN